MKHWAFLAVSALFIPRMLAAETSVVGTTYPIAEPDALAEIEARANAVNWPAQRAAALHAVAPRQADVVKWSAHGGFAVEPAPKDRRREHIPTYTLSFDITDGRGGIIYPRGFQFNPLEHVTLPYRIVVIAPQHVRWLGVRLQDTDMVILTAGDYTAVSEKLGRPTFLLNGKIKERLGIEYVPSIIEQEGQLLSVQEFLVEVDR